MKLHRTLLLVRGAALAIGLISAATPTKAQTIYGANHASISITSSGGFSYLYNGPGTIAFNGLAVDGSGNVYAANFDAPYSIYKITPGGGDTIFASTGSINPNAGLAFDHAGYLYATTNAGIMKFAPDGSSTIFSTTIFLAGLVFDSSNNLYAIDFNHDKILKFASDGSSSVFAATNGSAGQTSGLAFDGSNNLYITEQHTIEKFTPGGVGSVFVSLSAGNDFFGIVFDSGTGGLYVSHNVGLTSDMMTFDLNGASAVFSPNNGATFLAIQSSAIPEPATSAGFVGLTMLGVALLRRSSRRAKPAEAS